MIGGGEKRQTTMVMIDQLGDAVARLQKTVNVTEIVSPEADSERRTTQTILAETHIPRYTIDTNPGSLTR